MTLPEMIAAARAIVEKSSTSQAEWNSVCGQYQIGNRPVKGGNNDARGRTRRLEFRLFNGTKFVRVSQVNFAVAVQSAAAIAKTVVDQMTKTEFFTVDHCQSKGGLPTGDDEGYYEPHGSPDGTIDFGV